MLFGTLISALAVSVNAASFCNQASAEGSMSAPKRFKFYTPRVIPFYQFVNNDGYCAEVSLIQSLMTFGGAFTSQTNARALASTFEHPQTGKLVGSTEMAQLLLDSSSPPGCTECNSWGDAATKAKLVRTAFNSVQQAGGATGVQQFLTWVKKQVIGGKIVTMGVGNESNKDEIYHVVSVLGIESNYPANDTRYHADDVIYFDDHGLYALTGPDHDSNEQTTNPGIPPGATDSQCTPYKYGYLFGSFADEIKPNSRIYRLPLPGTDIMSKSNAYAVSGIVDENRTTKPVSLRIINNGWPADKIVGHNYENPIIGEKPDGKSHSNTIPAAQTMTFSVEVRDLTPGVKYNLYLYRHDSSVRSAFAAVPTSNFNKNAASATSKTAFTATGSKYNTTITIPSTTTIIYRCVPVTAA